MSGRISIVGMACRYPDAADTAQLWENVLAGRRAFRRIPDERMRQADYWSPDPAAPDRFYSPNAAVIEGYEFDRVQNKIAGSTYRVTDLTHWLALDTAGRALADAGFPGADGLPKRSTAVIVGNTLTGEFTRANLMRLRWPYVRRVVGAALQEQGWEAEELAQFLHGLESRYKAPFPPVDEDSLAGGLANTIAGRICNQFDLKGGGFTVDGACSSSLLSVAQACAALRTGQADAAVAGGVDLSIDPFEVIGFAKTGALATGEMRVYDKHSNGFWPGEGCGMVVLVREEDAVAQGLRSYATIAGWGYSSDGRGGITRPEADGHRLAVERAYEVAGFGFATVSYLEGHGTGTAVGDATELRALGQARRESCVSAPAAAISTIKGNIGHTKAAAGVAGLIKATLAVHHQVIPPATGHSDPHPELEGDNPALRVPATAELWPDDQPVRAGISAMGFGGINAHIVLESSAAARRAELDSGTLRLVSSRQDSEVLLLDAASLDDLKERVAALAELCAMLAYAELGDLAAELERELADRPVRAAIVAPAPQEAARRLTVLHGLLESGAEAVIDAAAGVFLGTGTVLPRIGYLFPGQGSGRRLGGGAIARRFDPARALYEDLARPENGDLADTAAAQPRIVAGSVAGLRVLSMLGIEATAAVGHSLGELTSLHWAGGMDEAALLRLAMTRGQVMATASDGGGAMASIATGAGQVQSLLRGEPVVIAGYNSPQQTVVSGPADAVERVCKLASEQGLITARVPVSHAFHSPAVAPAATQLDGYLADQQFAPLTGRVFSTVTSEVLPADTDLRDLLVSQVLEPVQFDAALSRLAADADLLLEVGPGRVLAGLASEVAPAVPVVAMETDSTSLSGALSAVAAAYALGAPVRHGQLFRDRFTRPLPPDRVFRFFASPCELAPADTIADADAAAGTGAQFQDVIAATGTAGDAGAISTLDLLRQLTAQRAELPMDAVGVDVGLLDALHVSSITVGQILNQAARELGVSAPLTTANLATATLLDLAQMLDDAGTGELIGAEELHPDGVAPWVRAFTTELIPQAAKSRTAPQAAGEWQVFAPAGHPLAQPLQRALDRAMLGNGVLLCLPADCNERHLGLMLDAARAALAATSAGRFVVVQDGAGAAGLAKTLHLEAPAIDTTVISMPLPAKMAAGAAAEVAGRVVADVAATAGFSEVRYDAADSRLVPLLRPVAVDPGNGEPGARELPIGASDVLLVTGGGKGITAECALALGERTGVAIGLLGRSDAASDADLAANLKRFEDAGVRHCYVRADVTSPYEVKAAVQRIASQFGPVTAVLHGAGRNEPMPLAQLDETAFLQTLGPKITGLDMVLAAVDPAALRLLITFGSIIGRAGLRGQADYATANDWLTDLTCKFQQAHPQCRAMALEWSVWSGAGMGERLGVLESLTREGISPIAVDEGIATLFELMARPDLPTALVIMGRVGDMPTIELESRELPLTRFIDRPRVYYPGIELVADAELSADSDPYLPDHLLDGEMLFPAVLGMEAMAQAAAALVEPAGQAVLSGAEFLRPIVVPVDGSVTVRIAALNRGGRVDVVIRSSDTGFQADHFRAAVSWSQAEPPDDGPEASAADLPAVPLDPDRDLYGPILFQGRRFQRVREYRSLAATSCVVEISAEPAGTADSWFGSFLPAELLLGDPGARDAFMHGIQCCVPNATLLPTGVDRIDVGALGQGTRVVVLSARERERHGDSYTYDLDVRDEDGRLVERWDGLRLQAVRKQDGSGPWPPSLLGPFLERQLAEVMPVSPRCAVEPDGDDEGRDAQRRQAKLAVSRMLGHPATVRYRRDGRLQVTDDLRIAVSHGAGVTVAVAHADRLGCDVHVVADRVPADWEQLLTPDQLTLAKLIGLEREEDLSVAATRVWRAVECLSRTGLPDTAAITLAEPGRRDAWVLLAAGQARIATFPTYLHNERAPVVFTILTEGGS
jgi:enediyne polyketide synthase